MALAVAVTDGLAPLLPSAVTCSYSSDRLYLEGGNSGVTCEDIVNKLALPQALQEELLRSRGQDVVSLLLVVGPVILSAFWRFECLSVLLRCFLTLGRVTACAVGLFGCTAVLTGVLGCAHGGHRSLQGEHEI